MTSINEERTKQAYELIKSEPMLKHLNDYDFEFIVLDQDKEKKSKGRTVFGECVKVNEIYKPFCPYDFLILIYPGADLMNEEQIRMLLIHEMLHMDIDDNNCEPKYSINPHDVEDFRCMIDAFGIDWGKVVE